MIRAVIFDPDMETARRLRHALTATGLVDVVGLYYNYPHFSQLERFLHMHQPALICAGTQSLDRCAGIAANARLLDPDVPVVATGNAPDPEDLMCLFDSGVHEFLGSPFDRRLVQSCVDRVTLQSKHGDTGRHSRNVHGACAGA